MITYAFFVMLRDGSVLWTAADSQCSQFGMTLAVCCLFAAMESHFSVMRWCALVGVLWGDFTLWYDYLGRVVGDGLCCWPWAMLWVMGGVFGDGLCCWRWAVLLAMGCVVGDWP